ncbi:hypothetical protein [Paludisphaera sp.]|uniref:hypothetical protein n=1 Tax=Paludisphaera sp. TaxID=2017432 RepID=UPI00301D9C5D
MTLTACARTVWFALFALCSTALWSPTQTADAVKIVIPERAYQVGEKVTAEITGSGEVVVENDIAAKSQQVKLVGATKVDLGQIREPGLYVVRVGGNGKWAAAAVLAAPGDPKKLTLSVGSDAGKDPSAVPTDLAQRFAGSITEARLKAAALAALKEWLPANVAALGKTTVACWVCVVPTGQFACGVCVGSTTGNVLGLGVEVAVRLVAVLEIDKVITADEAKALKFALKAGSGLVTVATGKDLVERALGAVKLATEVTVEHEGVKLVVGNAADQVDKTLWLIKAVKK